MALHVNYLNAFIGKFLLPVFLCLFPRFSHDKFLDLDGLITLVSEVG